MKPGPKPKPFWDRVDKNGPPWNGTPCWIWLGAKDKDGYPLVTFNHKIRRAHRWVYEELVGPIPEGLTLDHLCRVHACLNPSHLEPVTNLENVRRGISFSAEFGRATHCVRGHPFSSENTFSRGPNGQWRGCRTCHRDKSRERMRAVRIAKRRAA